MLGRIACCGQHSEAHLLLGMSERSFSSQQSLRNKLVTRWGTVCESFLVFSLIMLYIWRLRQACWGCWSFILGAVIVSHCLRKERPVSLGFQKEGLDRALAAVIRPLMIVVIGLLGSGAALGFVRNVTAQQAGFDLARYLIWGLFQQYLLNGYFVNRLHMFIRNGKNLCAAGSLLFAAAHAPNVFLMATALVGGYVCVWNYLKYRNLYLLGMLHGVVGFVLYLVVPSKISHGFLVGPSYFYG